MLVTIVRFKAYDKESHLAFINSEPVKIHGCLKGICDTYEPLSIHNMYTSIDKEEFLPLSTLQQLKKEFTK